MAEKEIGIKAPTVEVRLVQMQENLVDVLARGGDSLMIACQQILKGMNGFAVESYFFVSFWPNIRYNREPFARQYPRSLYYKRLF